MKRAAVNVNRNNMDPNGHPWSLEDLNFTDLNFTDDIVLLAYRHQDIQCKTNDVAAIGRQAGLNINTDKTKLMKINARSDQQATIDNKNITLQ